MASGRAGCSGEAMASVVYKPLAEHVRWRWGGGGKALLVTGRCGVDRHVIGGVIEKLCAGIAFNVMRIVVAPPQLDVEPIFGCCGSVVLILRLGKQCGLGDLLVRGTAWVVGMGDEGNGGGVLILGEANLGGTAWAGKCELGYRQVCVG